MAVSRLPFSAPTLLFIHHHHLCSCNVLIPTKVGKTKFVAYYGKHYCKQHFLVHFLVQLSAVIEDTLNRSEQVNIGNGTEKINAEC